MRIKGSERVELTSVINFLIGDYERKHSKFMNAACSKEEAYHRLRKARIKLDNLNRAEFEAAQAASSSSTKAAGKGGLASSIEKVFGTQGLELVQRALREEELSKEPSD